MPEHIRENKLQETFYKPDSAAKMESIIFFFFLESIIVIYFIYLFSCVGSLIFIVACGI